MNTYFSYLLRTVHKNVKEELKLIAQLFHANELSLNLENPIIFFLSLPGSNEPLNTHGYA